MERRQGVFQNRRVKGLRLQTISTLAAANESLASEFLSALNEHFTVEAREKSDVHRPVRRGVNLDVFNFSYGTLFLCGPLRTCLA